MTVPASFLSFVKKASCRNLVHFRAKTEIARIPTRQMPTPSVLNGSN